MYYIYVLECAHSCYYVGRSADPDARLAEHRAGLGAAWTRVHPPVGYAVPPRPIDAHDNPGLEEDKETKKWMIKRGLEFVRGGSYCQVDMSPETRQALMREFNHDDNRCINCGSNEHFVVHCPNRNNSVNDENTLLKVINTPVKYNSVEYSNGVKEFAQKHIELYKSLLNGDSS